MPLYSVKAPAAGEDKILKPPPKDSPRYHNVKIAPTALAPEEMATKIQACYKELGSIARLQVGACAGAWSGAAPSSS